MHVITEIMVATIICVELGEAHIFDGGERGFNELRCAAVDPEDATREVGVVTVDKVDQWLRGLHSRRTMENLMRNRKYYID